MEAISITLQEAVNTYLNSAHVRALESTTQEEYSKDLSSFARWCAEHVVIQDPKTKVCAAAKSDDDQIVLHEVNNQVVRLYLEHYRATAIPTKPGATEISTYTLRGCVRVLKAFLNWCAVDDEYQQHVSVTTVSRIEIPDVIEVVIQPFTDEQIEALFLACEKEESEHLRLRGKAILAIMLDTGVRANELVTLEIGNCSLDPRDPYIRVLGKGQKWGEVGLGEQSRRLLQQYIREFREPTLEHALKQEYRNLPPKQFKKLSVQAMAHEPVFMNRAGRQLTVWGLEQIFTRLGRRAHIEGVRCSPHTMRHSFAVRFWRRTHDIRTLSKLLRHASIAVTEHYLKSILQSEARQGAPSMFDELDDRTPHGTLTKVNISKKKGRNVDDVFKRKSLRPRSE